MKMFHIESSQNSPDVRIDGQDGIMEISGNSTFERPNDFYRQVARWVHAFHKDAKEIQTVNVKFSELDKASIRWMMFLLKEVEKISSDRNNMVVVNWYYNGNNESVRSTGENCKSQVKLPFNLIAA
ncbi:MAG: SiaC family regulatory phosphoprotein [Bacteroidales bacterium]